MSTTFGFGLKTVVCLIEIRYISMHIGYKMISHEKYIDLGW